MKELVKDLDETLDRLRVEITERCRVLREVLYEVENSARPASTSTFSGSTLSSFSGVVNADPVELAKKIAEYNARLLCRRAIASQITREEHDQD